MTKNWNKVLVLVLLCLLAVKTICQQIDPRGYQVLLHCSVCVCVCVGVWVWVWMWLWE